MNADQLCQGCAGRENAIRAIEGQKPHVLFHRLKELFKNEHVSTLLPAVSIKFP